MDVINAVRVAQHIPIKPREAMSDKAEYRSLCETERSIAIFSTDWWLDAAVGRENWDVVLVKANGRIIGAMPFVTTRRFGLKLIYHPPLTPFLGPWISPTGEKSSTKLSSEQKIMQSLIEQLPRFDYFRQTWNKGFSNWLPFYWNGFNQTTEYTYVINGLDNLDGIWRQLDNPRRKHCKGGAEHFRIRDDLPVEAFLALHKMTLKNRNVSQTFTDESLFRLDAACAERNQRKILIAVDDEGRHCAGTYSVWDNNCAYALMKGSDPSSRCSDAQSYCQWEAIKFCSTVAFKYDFLGNMNPSIEPYVRSFGAEQTSIFTISKTPSRLLLLREAMRTICMRSRK